MLYKWNVSGISQWINLQSKWYTWIDWDFDLSCNMIDIDFNSNFPKQITWNLIIDDNEILLFINKYSKDKNKYTIPENIENLDFDIEKNCDKYDKCISKIEKLLEKDFISFIQLICKIDKKNINIISELNLLISDN